MSHTVLPIELEILIEDVADVILDFDQVQIHRSTTVEGGPYVEITDQYTRIGLLANVQKYLYQDLLGSSDYWYKFRYYNSTSLAVSAFSAAQPGALDAALGIMSVEELKTNYLFGVDLTKDDGEPYPDSLYAFYIMGAVSWLEHAIDICLRKTVIEAERHDYFREESSPISFIVDRYPVISVEEVKLVLPGEQTLMTFPKSWIQLSRESGQIEIVPSGGSMPALLATTGGAWLFASRRVGTALRVKYTAGFAPPPAGSYGFPPGTEPVSLSYPDPALDRLPAVLKEMVGKYASFGPLNIAGDLVGGAGLQGSSLSIDGLSQSVTTTNSSTNAGFGARLLQYLKELKAQLPVVQKYYRGVRMRVA